MNGNNYGVGIDFGTTNSIAAIYKTSLKETQPLYSETTLPHPSVVWYKADGSITVGVEAKKNIMGFSEVEGNRFISSIKRHLGLGESISIFGRNKPAKEVAAEIFKHIICDSDIRHKYPLKSGVVTIPIYFDGWARRELREAANAAGFFIKTFIHEPFAAIVGYCHRNGQGLQMGRMDGQTFLVFDWGGGTLDITAAAVINGDLIELATGGIADRAGDYFDKKLERFAIAGFREKLGVSANELPILSDRLLEECERAKISLSSKEKENIQVAQLCHYNGRFQNINEPISRADFDDLINRDIKDAIGEVEQALDVAGITSREIDIVLLVGGSSRIPLLHKYLREKFGARMHEVERADAIIAEGAATIDALGLQPVLARSVNVELSDGSLYEIFKAGEIANPDICRKRVNFFCTDNRDGQAKLVIKEVAGRKSSARPLTNEVLSIPVNPDLPSPYNHERVTADFALDEDMVLHVAAKGATQVAGSTSEIYKLCFGLKI
ncbi:MAG: Hsp70 family protein [Syntrophales bacterium]|nr:Hsp70 family protein [Syntrophales bacterium]